MPGDRVCLEGIVQEFPEEGTHEFGSVRCVGTIRWMGEERAFQAKGKCVPVTHRGGDDF